MKYKGFIPYIFGAFCTAVYLSLVFNNNIWLDEAFSASIIRCGFDEMISRTFTDTLPPFYNMSAWLFTHVVGFSTVKLKIYSVIPMALLMLTAAYYIPKAISIRASCLYMIMLTVMPHFLEHGVEIRMYSWAVLFCSATAIFAVCVIKAVPHTEAGLIACTVLGAYTHQYALIAEAFVWLMLLVFFIKTHSLKKWLVWSSICITAYIPCAVLTFFQMKTATTYFSAGPADLNSLLSSIRYPFVTNITLLSALLMISVILLFIYSCIRKSYISSFFIIVYILVVFLSFAIMKITGSTFFTSRYLMPAFGLLWLGAAISLDRLLSENRYVYFAAVPLFLVLFCVIYMQQFRTEYTDMSEFEAFIASTSTEDGYTIYEDFPEIEICLEYYAPWLKSYNIEELSNVKGRKYIFINRGMHVNDIKKIKDDNFDLKYIEDLMFDRYIFRAYELITKDP